MRKVVANIPCPAHGPVAAPMAVSLGGRPLLADAGFERVCMEDLGFAEQVRLMRSTCILFAPHGAGLTNMLFCPSRTGVVEIADLSFPNPNFHAIASALGSPYWLLAGSGVGDGHPLECDLHIKPRAITAILPGLEQQAHRFP